MLILTRKLGESIMIGDRIEVILTEMNNNSVRLGINAPKDMPVYRKEIYEKILKENRKASSPLLDSKEFEALNRILSQRVGG
jgi:carbon storage regulator